MEKKIRKNFRLFTSSAEGMKQYCKTHPRKTETDIVEYGLELAFQKLGIKREIVKDWDSVGDMPLDPTYK